jgi:hypothetical protein
MWWWPGNCPYLSQNFENALENLPLKSHCGIRMSNVNITLIACDV